MENNYTNYYRTLHNDISIPINHINYLGKIDYSPKVIYDIGAAVGHWTKEAKKIWPDAKIYGFEAVTQVEEWFKEYYGDNFAIGVFSDSSEKELIFYNNPICLGGNSYYKENEVFSPAAKTIYGNEFEEKRTTLIIDTVVDEKRFELPDLVKIDVQGAELDILKGMTNTLKNVKHLIVELQHVQYNIGAQLVNDSIPFIESLGFELIVQPNGEKYFCGNGPDGDYHFIKK